MKRIICALFLCCAALYFWQDLLGFSLKTALRITLKARLAYRDLHVTEGQLVLEDAVLFDVSGGKSGYLLRADTLGITWEKWRSFFVKIDKCNLTLCADTLRQRWNSSGASWVQTKIEITEGTLDWSDGLIPPAQFCFSGDELDMAWERGGTISARKSESGIHVTGSSLPLFLAIPDSQGIIDGTIDLSFQHHVIHALSLHLQGTDVAFDIGSFRYGGSFTLDWAAKEIASLDLEKWIKSTERFRLSLDHGVVADVLHEGKFLATFQTGLGGKWEGEAKTEEGLCLAIEGKVLEGESPDVFGFAHFGEAEATLTQKERDPFIGLVEWNHLGPKEVASIQRIMARIDPRIMQYTWTAGTASGSVQFNEKGHWQCPHMQVNDLCLQVLDIGTSCKQLVYKQGDWAVEDLRVKTILPVQFAGNGKFEWSAQRGALEGRLGDSEVRIFYDRSNLFGSIGEFIFEGKAEAEGLSIPRFGGKLPSWLSQCYLLENFVFSSGRISSLQEGFTTSWDGNWSLACKLEQSGFDYAPIAAKISDIQCELYADVDKIDVIAAKGSAEILWGNQLIATRIFAPHIRYAEKEISFDLRFVEQEWDWLRVVGKKSGDRLEIDPAKSLLLGAQLQAEGVLQQWRMQANVPWNLLQLFLKKRGYPLAVANDFDGTLHLSFTTEGGAKLVIEGSDWIWHNRALPILASPVVLGPFIAHCQIDFLPEGWRIHSGSMNWKDKISFDLEGKLTDSLRFNGVVDHMMIDLSILNSMGPIQGILEGKGCFSLGTQFEADFDMLLKDSSIGGYAIENSVPLYCSIASDGRALFKGIDCKISADDIHAHVTTDVLEVDWQACRLKATKVRAVSPTNLIPTPILDRDREIVLFGNAEFTFDGSDWTYSLQEGFLPIGGGVRHITDCRLGRQGASYAGGGHIYHQGQKAWLSWMIHDDGRGKISLQEAGSPKSLLIDGTLTPAQSGLPQLSIYSVEGQFAGIAASFRAVDHSHLVGSANIDFAKLSAWVPPDVAYVFKDLDMGAGYELKGHLSFAPEDLSFTGLLCGKEIDLFGFQLRTLMAQAELRPDRIHLRDLLISDAAGSLVIPELLLQGTPSPWTIQIPTLTIRDLRPSLLQKPGEEKKALTPLVVRNLTIRDFQGLLADGKTYRASGDLSFINSFKRGKSVFDLPTHLFGRIVGLDLELLIPVEGKLLFELKDGYFVLTDLLDSFSEAGRSQFFLAEQEVPPRMSLRGDLEIFVRMKHFVLFALTEAFMISIDGKLSDPQFHLQKKKG